MNARTFLSALCALAVAGNARAHDGHAVATAAANDTRGKETVTLLQRKMLPDMAGKSAIMATVQYAPGQASLAHEHPGSVFAYVLEGAVISQMEGAAPVTYRKGDSLYEAPHQGHLVSSNASQTRPATLLVFLLAPDGAPILKPR